MFEYLHHTIPFSLEMYHDLGAQYNIISRLFSPVFWQIMLPLLKSSLVFIIFIISLFDLLSSDISVNKYIEKNNKEEANYKVHIAEIIIIVLINPFILSLIFWGSIS